MRYIDLNTQTEYIPAIHGALPEDGQLPANLQALPDDHWFWQRLPEGKAINVVNGGLVLVDIEDVRTLDDLRSAALSLVNIAADKALLPLTSRYPSTEIQSWTEQAHEAMAWLTDNTVSTPLLDSIAAGADKMALCQGIVANAAVYKAAVGKVIAWRRSMAVRVQALSTREALIALMQRISEAGMSDIEIQ